MSNVIHCGACNRACSGANVASVECIAGRCESACDIGFANCTRPAAPAADNGCELNVRDDTQSCGGCNNTCSGSLDCDQMLGPGSVQMSCGCSSALECGSTAASCDNGLCTCGSGQCAPGEACIPGPSRCACFGGPACGVGQTCCGDPTGCFNLATDPANCGACGRRCPTGFACVAGECSCDEDADCLNDRCIMGSGRCACNTMTCASGERCQRDGQCG